MLSLFQFIRSPSSTLAAWKKHLENPEIHVVERLAAAVVTLQFLQFICHRVRFWARRHWSVRWGAFYLPVPLSALAVAVMMLRSPPCPPYWLVAIFFAAGQADTMAAYSLHDDDKRSVRRFAKHALYLAYLSVLFFNHHDGPTSQHQLVRRKEMLSLALGFVLVLQDLRISSRAMVSSSEICKIAVDHVRFSQNRSTFSSDDGDEPEPLAAAPSVVAVGSLESYRSAVSGCTTLEDIRRVSGAGGNSRLKLEDACLSSALFLQLLRQHRPADTAHQPMEPSSANHAFKERLPHFLGMDWAFERVEVQLSFMRDYFFSVHGSPSRTSHRLFVIYSILKISFLLSVRSLMLEEEQGRLNRATLYALILLELCQLVGYLISDGFLVSSMSDLLKEDQDQMSSAAGTETNSDSILPTLFSLLLKLLGWKSRVYLGQYSLIDDLCCKTGLKQRLMMGIKRRPRQKETIADSGMWSWIGGKAISSEPGRFAFRVRPRHSMRVSESLDALSWTLSQETTIHTILIWHIATWFCGMAADDDQDTKQLVFAERVFPSEFTYATRLSNYCAYLVAFRPELLPEHHALATSIFEEAVRQAKLGFTRYASSADELYAMMKSRNLRIYYCSDKACYKQGIKLGQQLMRYSGAERWKVMAEFWAEMTLFVAQSGSADAHIERLATGGEFVTQLWAFLSNGWDRTFIRRHTDDDCMDLLPAFQDIGRDILKKAAEYCQNSPDFLD